MELGELLKKGIKWFFIIFYVVIVLALFGNGIAWGVITMLPDEASKPCLLGYYAHCSYTPISTVITFAIGVVGLFLSVKAVKFLKRKYEEDFKKDKN